MYTQEQQWALDQFDALQKNLGSQAKACKQVGISAAIMTPLRKETYTGDCGKQLQILVDYFKIKEEARTVIKYDDPDYVPTSISQNVYEVMRNCQLKGGFAIACGDAGIGKTRAAKKFASDHPNDAVYITLNPCFTTLKSLLKLLGNRLGVTERTNYDMWLGIADKLRDGMIIIFDESQHLPLRTVEALRALTDHFYERKLTLGIVFVGNAETVSHFGGRKRAEFAQISNRTRQKKLFGSGDIRREDIQLLFPVLTERGMDKEIDFLLGIARSSQAIRGASNLFSNAYDNDNISYEGLVAMAKHMEMRF